MNFDFVIERLEEIVEYSPQETEKAAAKKAAAKKAIEIIRDACCQWSYLDIDTSEIEVCNNLPTHQHCGHGKTCEEHKCRCKKICGVSNE